MRLLLLLSLCLLAPRAAWAALPWAERWEAQLQARGIGQDEARFPFETTVEMERFAAQAVRGCRRGTERLGCLQRALFDPDGLGFTYDDSHTRDARQAFADGRGDCFAFSTLFVALARSLGADARLVSVPGPPSSTRLLDGSVLVTEHLAVMSFSAGRAQLFDFQQGDSDARRFVALEDRVASAMLHANRGGRLLRDGESAAALPELELAARLAPEWPVAWIDLGVARRRAGDRAGAYEAYAQALSLQPSHPQALNNLACLYGFEGQAQARQAALRAASRSGHATPWSLVALADARLAQGELRAARWLLLRARWERPGTAEVLAALGRWAERAGKSGRAARHLRRAEVLRGRS